MPVQYAGLISEHLAVRQFAGLFDVSHMGELEITGPGALTFLQRVTPGDVAGLVDGQGQYTSFPMPSGAPVDDVVLFRRSRGHYFVIVNAANIEKDYEWLLAQSPRDCEIANRSDEFALIALQGPKAEAILSGLTSVSLSGLRFYHCTVGEVAGLEVVVSRTGYTGEDGFELMLPSADAPALWRRLIEVGAPSGLVPVGLGARDTLRLEAKMCLYGNDIDESTTLVEAGLGWTVCLNEGKGDFIGRDVLADQKANGARRALVGFELVGRGIARPGYPVFLAGQEIAAATSGSHAPFLRKSIGLCYMPKSQAAVGTEIEVGVRGQRVAARVVRTPFYRRSR